jgi:hypothetical protein
VTDFRFPIRDFDAEQVSAALRVIGAATVADLQAQSGQDRQAVLWAAIQAAEATGTDRTTAAAAFVTARQLLGGTRHTIGDTLDRAVALIEQVAVVDAAEAVLAAALDVEE